MTDAGRLDLDQDLAFTGAFELHGRNFEGLSGGDGKRSANIHAFSPGHSTKIEVARGRTGRAISPSK
jgi:hypothetical protein